MAYKPKRSLNPTQPSAHLHYRRFKDRTTAYRLGKRAISQFIRSDCQRRLRLDLFATARDRAAASAPDKDNRHPGLAFLTQAGRSHERRKFAELIEVLPGHPRRSRG
jgi:hypothetical protein